MSRFVGFCLFTLLVQVATLANHAAHAESFTVRASVYCIGFALPQPEPPPIEPGQSISARRVFDARLRRPEHFPCPNILVEAWDADPGSDDYCGSGYTNLSGSVTFAAGCDDFSGRPNVYLKVVHRSSSGFEVRTYDLLEASGVLALEVFTTGGLLTGAIWDTILNDFSIVTASDQIETISAETRYPDNDATLSFQLIGLGDPNIPSDQKWRWRTHASAAFSLMDMSERKMFVAAGGHPLLPGTEWIMDSIVGGPTTLWNKIIASESRRTCDNCEGPTILRSVPHELEHVFHNKHHSGKAHWLWEALDYAFEHDRCVIRPVSIGPVELWEVDWPARFAWYEGFASYVSDYVFTDAGWWENSIDSSGRLYYVTTYKPTIVPEAMSNLGPEGDCTMRSAEKEGKITAFLNALSMGEVQHSPEVPTFGFKKELGAHLSAGMPFAEGRTQVRDVCGSGGQLTMASSRARVVFNLVANARILNDQGEVPGRHNVYDYWDTFVKVGGCPEDAGGGFKPYCRSASFFESMMAMIGPGIDRSIGFPFGYPQCLQVVNPPIWRRAPSSYTQVDWDRIVHGAQKRRQAKVELTAAGRKYAVDSANRWLQRVRRETMRRDDVVKRGYPADADFIEFGITPQQIKLGVDFATSVATSGPANAPAPFIQNVLSAEAATTLNRAPTKADVDRLSARKDAVIGELNAALGKVRQQLAGIAKVKGPEAMRVAERNLVDAFMARKGLRKAAVIKDKETASRAEMMLQEANIVRARFNAEAARAKGNVAPIDR